MRKATDQRDAQTISLLFHSGDVNPFLMSWRCLRGEMKSCGWLWGDVGWATVVSCDGACHVMSIDVVVTSFDGMWLLVLCHVTWCNAMSWLCPAVGWNVMSLRCQWLWSHSYLWFEVVLWWCGDPKHYSFCTTKYYNVLLHSYKVLVQYNSVPQSTTKYYSSTLYCKVLVQY